MLRALFLNPKRFWLRPAPADRSSIFMAYLRTKGYNARYLTDGLTGLAEALRGDEAREFREDTGCCP